MWANITFGYFKPPSDQQNYTAEMCFDGDYSTKCNGGLGYSLKLIFDTAKVIAVKLWNDMDNPEGILNANILVEEEVCALVPETEFVIVVFCDKPILGNELSITTFGNLELNLMEVEIIIEGKGNFCFLATCF